MANAKPPIIVKAIAKQPDLQTNGRFRPLALSQYKCLTPVTDLNTKIIATKAFKVNITCGCIVDCTLSINFSKFPAK